MIHRVAAVVDVRSHGVFADFGQIVAELGRGPGTARRSSSSTPPTRPWSAGSRASAARTRSRASGRLLDGIQRERALLGELRSEADVILDTSGLNVHQLAAKAMSLFAGDGRGPAAARGHVVRVQVRRPARRRLRPRPPLPAQPVLGPGAAAPDRPRRGGGRVRPVPAGGQGVRRRRRATSWTRCVRGSSARAVATSRSRVGCTGGKHRSVAIAEQLAERLRTDTVDTFLVHRDLGRE